MANRRWVRICGDGCLYSGACLVHTIIVYPPTAADYSIIYDGRDTTSGKVFCSVYCSASNTWKLNLGQGVSFDRGVYVDGKDADVETTIVFTPL